jgi:tetratricopeptide (TPR) repeat protein
VQMQLARRDASDGRLPEAEAAFRRAMQSDPVDPGPRRAFLKFLVEQQRYDEALALTDVALKQTPRDASLLLDRGMLALRRGHGDEAVANWNQALAVDPHQYMAQLYLANEFDREGKAEAAAAHYDAFLERIAKQKPEDRPAPDQVIAIVMRMADCQARSFQSDRAIRAYQLAEKLAVQTSQSKLESVADVNEAELQSRIGGLDEALRLYQRALQLDKTAADDNATAQDWLAYGRFLEEKDFPVRLAYACLVKSESLLPPPHNTSDPVTVARQQIEKRLGPEAAAIRRDPEPALREALALRR